MLDHSFDEYLQFLDKQADKWYKKLFVNFVKKHFPAFVKRQYMKWQVNMFVLDVASKPGFTTSMTNHDFDKLVAIMKYDDNSF